MPDYPKTREEFKQFAGKWVKGNDNLDLPKYAKIIVGREDLSSNMPYNCLLCFQTTYLTARDKPVLDQGAVPICSACYLKGVKC